MPASGVALCSENDRWGAGRRAAFRFAVLYFGLYCLTTQILGGLFPIPKINIPDLAALAPVRPTVQWTAAHIFGVKTQLVFRGSGSGDKTFDWVLAFCTLIASALGAAVWTALDRGRAHYARAYRWFHLGMRFALGSEMLLYGFAKLVPLQMPFPFLSRLVEPYGNFSPMGVLWSAVGASPVYEIFTGSAETLAGVLLFFPRTAIPGALLSLANSTYIFTLNMTYDVPVKLFAFHLIVMSVVLLGPELRRLARFLLGGAVAEARLPVWGRRAVALQAVYGLLLVAVYAWGDYRSWHQYGGGAPKSELYGIWNIEPPGVEGWRRVIFDRPGFVTLQKMDDLFTGYGARIDAASGMIGLTKGSDKNWKAEWKFQRAGADGLKIDGQMDGRPVHMDLKRLDRSKLLLVSRGFHWIQEYPFNR